ncbi:hypothetical protein [Mucilaginibacter rubeus]|uniref:Uncharacterized protein n=1 Tax=Mucilaginibacter rubeus TaxID=2027860 RepID=A0A5C1I4I2_9SPHI|nr:hypothetical protein [Mucilaginibacter rubeus]QEM12766.1 hypothetical protein DEO27_023040 [Mucilaginibacter rubeus]
MKKLNLPLYVILIVIAGFCTTTCGKSSDGGGGGGGGVIVLLGDLIGFWQHDTDSFTFDGQDNKLGGSGTVGGQTGTVSNSKIDKYQFSFDLVFADNSVKSYTGTIDDTKKVIKLTTGSTTTTFNKQ